MSEETEAQRRHEIRARRQRHEQACIAAFTDSGVTPCEGLVKELVEELSEAADLINMFIQESPDPGTGALAAVYRWRVLLGKIRP